MLAVGTRLRGQETGDFVIKLPPNIIQIDTDPLANGRTYANSYFVCGDAQATLEALLPRIEGQPEDRPGYRSEFAALKRDRARRVPRHARRLRHVPRAVASRDAEGCDLGARRDAEQHHLGQPHVPGVQRRTKASFRSAPASARDCRSGIGAAAAANGRKTVVMTGDGGFFLNVGELWTAVQEKLDMTVIVMNDRGYGVIKRIQDATAQGRRFFADLQGPDLAQAGRACRHAVLEGDSSADAFGATVAKAIAHTGPTMVEVDMTAVGEFPAYYPFNQRHRLIAPCAACSDWPRCLPSPGR